MDGKSGHIFLSHGSDNREQANELTRYLESRGLKIWIAPRDVRPGVDYSEALQQAIEACAAFIVLVTDKANRSPYVRVETEMAFSLEKPIFPIRTSDVKPGPGLALFLKIRHWTDAFGALREESLDRLALELRTIAGMAEAEAGPEPESPQVAAAAPTPPPAPPVAPPAQPSSGLPGIAIAGIAGGAVLLLLVLVLLLRPAAGPVPGPAQPVPQGSGGQPQAQPQPQQPVEQLQPGQQGDVYYTPPDDGTAQQDPPQDVYYDPPE